MNSKIRQNREVKKNDIGIFEAELFIEATISSVVAILDSNTSRKRIIAVLQDVANMFGIDDKTYPEYNITPEATEQECVSKTRGLIQRNEYLEKLYSKEETKRLGQTIKKELEE